MSFRMQSFFVFACLMVFGAATSQDVRADVDESLRRLEKSAREYAKAADTDIALEQHLLETKTANLIPGNELNIVMQFNTIMSDIIRLQIAEMEDYASMRRTQPSIISTRQNMALICDGRKPVMSEVFSNSLDSIRLTKQIGSKTNDVFFQIDLYESKVAEMFGKQLDLCESGRQLTSHEFKKFIEQQYQALKSLRLNSNLLNSATENDRVVKRALIEQQESEPYLYNLASPPTKGRAAR